MLSSLYRLFFMVSLAGIAACSGSPDRNHATVTGTVKLDGQPLNAGSVEFRTLNSAGVVASSRISNGSFTVTKAARLAPGTYKIVVRSPRRSGKKIAAGSPAIPGTMVDEVVETVPSQYNTSTLLEGTVERGDNNLDFQLLTK